MYIKPIRSLAALVALLIGNYKVQVFYRDGIVRFSTAMPTTGRHDHEDEITVYRSAFRAAMSRSLLRELGHNDIAPGEGYKTYILDESQRDQISKVLYRK